MVAEVWAFLFGFGMPMAQLDPTTTIIGNTHHTNTLYKPPLAEQGPNPPVFRVVRILGFSVVFRRELKPSSVWIGMANPFAARWSGSLAVVLSLSALTLPPFASQEARAQSDLRSTFPGRRVGGGTRGECNSRLIVHLVPETSVYAGGSPPLLGVIQGPAVDPRPLELRFRPQGGAAVSAEQQLPASGPAVVLVKGPTLTAPTIWESSYRCDEQIGGGASGDPLQFVQSTSPPALSLLVRDVSPADQANQVRLVALQKRCGGTIPRSELAAAFGLSDLLDGDWPDQLPVRCPT
jgi:hypothetical protein